MFELIEIGHYALIIALGTAVAQIAVGASGVLQKDMYSIILSARAAKITFYLVSVAFLALIVAFLDDDFSIRYVAQHSNTYLPWYYKISAAWAGHEGSLLLWVWILVLWSYLVAIKTSSLPPNFCGKVLAVLGVIASGFLSFVILTSNPFMRLLPTNGLAFPVEGKELNPMLQDIGLILHPPLLYMGYVGFAVSFTFIVAALFEGRLDRRWARWCRPWTILAWAFLTIGIVLGSWWAYYELGWGGWWFWDPVENASFMPWLAGTALLHSLSATEKRDVFKIWTAFLAIATFSLSLIGTFLVRSGVLTSVHAFANDPARGIYILMLLALISGSAFFLLIIRAHKLHGTGQFEWVSREMGLLVNNVILSIGCLIVFVGTLAPLLYDVLGWQRISVGAPYFNAKMLWVLLLMLVFLTFAPFLRWKRDRLKRLAPQLVVSLLLAIVVTYALLQQFDWQDKQAFILLTLTTMAIFTTLFDGFMHLKKHRGWPNLAYLSMFVGHLGFLVCCIGIIITSTYSIEKDLYVGANDTLKVQNLTFESKGIDYYENNRYTATAINFLVRDNNGEVITLLTPEKRNYHIARMPMSEVALLPGLTADLYVALGEPQGKTPEDSGWSVRIQIKPYIRWIWLGGLIMALASVFVLRDKHYVIRGRR
ncbi:MAG: heme lyase NrfEFG subunit NrfE [Gammaproteobacteria bacterium]|nr:MAG: heme lyase NrfEFG subunit NrfE [Gammaproteobacteria bacterium]